MDTDLTPTPTKSPDDTEIDTPPHTTHLNNHNHRHIRREHHQTTAAVAVAVTYNECMKNHAAAIGAHAVDGCGEFMPSPSSSATDPTSLTCAACGCHRNFHRRDPDSAITPPFLDFRHPLPKRFSISTSPSSSPPPPTVAFPPQAFFGVSSGPVTPTVENNAVGRKRFRTKFSEDQKEKMHCFSAKVDWKMQKCDEAAVREFCREIGVSKGVLKVWMHNNKNTFGKKEVGNGSFETNGGGGGGGDDGRKINNLENGNGNGVHLHASSSSSPSTSPA